MKKFALILVVVLGMTIATVQAGRDPVMYRVGRVDVVPVGLVTVTITPETTIELGMSTQLMATCEYDDGRIQNCTAQMSWISLNPGRITIDSTGMVTGVGIGPASVAVTAK